jgi:hypothetical protein
MSTNEKKRDDEPRLERIKLSDLREGPIQHPEGTPPELERVLRWQYRHVGHLVHPTYEQWELGFMRDANMVQEIALWTRMTWAALESQRRHPERDRDAVFRSILGLSMGKPPGDDEERDLLELMKALPEEYADISSPVFDQ